VLAASLPEAERRAPRTGDPGASAGDRQTKTLRGSAGERAKLQRLLRPGAPFAAKAMVLSAAADDAALKIPVRRIGPALVFERFWEESGCWALIGELAGKRNPGFALERGPCGEDAIASIVHSAGLFAVAF
jgi:hypothetical protein